MPTIALLRGVNVGGHRKVPMAQLRAALDDAGLGPAQTYVQSGNIILHAPAGTDTKQRIEQVLAAEFHLDDVPVTLRTTADIEGLLASNPFPAESDADPRQVHVVFLEARPASGTSLDPDRSPADRFHLDGTHLWIHYANGSGNSKLDLAYIERTLKVGGTARNLNTVIKLVELDGA